MSVVLAADRLTRVFGDWPARQKITAVDRVSFEVRRGEVVGLLGPNGAGKSTTVRLLLGLLWPTSGSAQLLGRPPEAPRRSGAVGYLPEETRLWPHLTGRETLRLLGRLERASADVDSLIDRVGLSSAADRKVAGYSKGMARRLGVAQALLGTPEVLVLDEPTSGLDPLGRRDMKALIGELARAGATVLLSSHLLAEVEDVCDRVLVLCSGRLVAAGALDELVGDSRQQTITLPTLAPDALSRVLAAIRAECGPEAELSVAPRRRSLEAAFLELVAREQQADAAK